MEGQIYCLLENPKLLLKWEVLRNDMHWLFDCFGFPLLGSFTYWGQNAVLALPIYLSVIFLTYPSADSSVPTVRTNISKSFCQLFGGKKLRYVNKKLNLWRKMWEIVMMISSVIGAAGFSQWSFMSRFRLFGKNPNPTDFVGLSDIDYNFVIIIVESLIWTVLSQESGDMNADFCCRS